MNDQLQFHIFGFPQITWQGQAVTGFVSNKARGLLIYLAITGRPHSRDALAALLWSDRVDSARVNLRKALHNLRRLPGVSLQTPTPQLIGLDPNRYWTDVNQFEQLAAEAHDRDALQRAVQLYQADFLVGFNTSLSYEFEAWALGEQARLKTLMVELLRQLAAIQMRQQERSGAIVILRRLLQLEPWREEVHRQLMGLLAEDGQRGAALAQFEQCQTLLAEELGVEPEEETVTLYRQLQQTETEVKVRPSAPSVTKVDYKLVGRVEEWANLRRCWQRLSRPHFVCISGEAGLGKTRLAEELLMLVEGEGKRVARARYHALQGRLAYGPVVDWLRSESLRPVLARLERIWLTELARLLPELLRQHPGLEPPQPMQQAWQRQRLFEALNQVVIRTEAPSLLLLDDLQWGDVDTLEWLQYLLERLSMPLLVVGTLRSDEVTIDHPLHSLRQQLQRSGQFTELALSPLTTPAGRELARQVAEQPLTGEQTAHLHRDTAGNPLFIIESVRMMSIGAATPAMEIVAVGGSDQQPVAIPAKVYSVIQARLAQLSPVALKLAQLGAAVGRPFGVELLARASSQPEAVVLEGLDELWQRRIIREVVATYYDFSHDRIRDVSYAEISPLTKMKYHRQVAQALETNQGDALRQISGELATHYDRGGQHQQALKYYLLAVEAAKTLYAHVDVVDHLQKTIAILQLLPKSKELGELEVDLWFRLGLAEIIVTYFGSPRVATAWEKAYELARQTTNAFLRGQTLLGMAIYRKNRGQWLESFEYSELAVQLSVAINDPYLQSQIFVEHGGALYHLGRSAAALAYFDKVFELENDAVAPSFEWFNRYPNRNALLRSAKALWILGYPDKARIQCKKAIALLDSVIDLELYWQEQFPTLDFSAMLYSFLGDTETVETLATQLIELSTKYQYIFYKRAARMFIGWVTAHRGDPETGCRLIRDSVYGHYEQGNRMFEPYWRAMLAEALMLANQVNEALAEVDLALSSLEQSGNNFWTAHLLTLKGNCLLAQAASVIDVEHWYHQAVDIAREQGAKSLELRATVSLCRLWQRQGKQKAAYQQLSTIYDWFSEGFDTPDLGQAKALLAELGRAA